jgi:hypothetical protein
MTVAWASPARAVQHGAMTGVTINQAGAEQANPNEGPARNALAQVKAASAQVALAIARLNNDFDQSQETRDARTAVAAATSSYRQARDGTLVALRAESSYRSLQLRIESNVRALDSARLDDKITPAKRQAMAGETLRLRSALSKLEAAVIDADPSVGSARDAMIDAKGKMLAIRRAFEESISDDPGFRDAKSRLDDARANLRRLTK